MLFSSYSFIFLFLPLFILAWRFGPHLAGGLPTELIFLFFSLLFYSFWGLPWLLLLLLLATANYCVARMLLVGDTGERSWQKFIFCGGILLNLLPLIWFKYSWFIVQNVALAFHATWKFTPPALPLGISFYTFIQIAWLTGIYRREFKPVSIQTHLLFSCCFPYVICGPIVRYPQVGWQLTAQGKLVAHNLARGISLFVMGLAKKALLADPLGTGADAVFGAAQAGWAISPLEAWGGSLCYTFQLYFDFSGYTDMALGIALMIGIRLPENFNSPYKSSGIVDFWRRWHITLGSWLRDFLYIPLGGNRNGKPRQYLNLFLTMLLGGIWHGAGWTFMLWGALHGAMLSLNHFFRTQIRRHAPLQAVCQWPLIRCLFILLTFFCLNFCWIIFRAPSLECAWLMARSMFASWPLLPMPSPPHPSMMEKIFLWFRDLAPHNYLSPATFLMLGLSMAICWSFPNSGQIIRGETTLAWRPELRWACFIAILFTLSLICLSGGQTFLYFQF